MPTNFDYSFNSYKLLSRNRPLSSDSRSSDQHSRASEKSIKSDVPAAHQILSKLGSSKLMPAGPIVLTIRKNEIQKEIAEIEKTKTHQMFFKKKKQSSDLKPEQPAAKTEDKKKQPVKSSLKAIA